MNKQTGINFFSVLGGFLFGLLIAFIGGYFVYALYSGGKRAQKTRSWEETPCFILKSEIEEFRPTPNSPMQYQTLIEYEYTFRGVTLRGNRIKRVEGPTSHKQRAEQKIADFPSGSSTTCWVDPAAPQESILKHDSLAPWYSIWFPGLFVVGGAGISVRALMGIKTMSFRHAGKP